MKNFVLIGAAGYVAPRHMDAIKKTGNRLIAALDPNDSVGVIDAYFPEAAFFTEFERFDRHLEKFRLSGGQIDYVSVCSPNYLHDAHIRFGLRHGADVICEKPLVLNPWNLDALAQSEKAYKGRVYNILQLRLHPSVIALRQKVAKASPDQIWDIDLSYITSRGKWYYASWKGAIEKSGGIASNIGIHFFDMLIWIFGDVVDNEVHLQTHDRAAGFLRLERASVKWFLSINGETLPEEVKATGKSTYRSLKIGKEEFEFSGGFTDLHYLSYSNILEGNGFGLAAARKAIDVVHDIRNRSGQWNEKNAHQLASLPLSKHPFER